MRIDVDTRGIDRLILDLEKTRKQAVPFAIRDSLNTSAFLTRFTWQGALRENLVLRNRFVERSVLVDKARGLNPATMEARVGSTYDEMPKQEFGGTEHGAVPAPAASGETGLPRRRLVRAPNRLPAIQLGRRVKRGSQKRRNAATIAIARRQGRKFVYLETSKVKGIFRLIGGKRSGGVRPVWLTTRKVHRVVPTPTLGPALEVAGRKFPEIHRQAFIKQLRRHRLLGY